ncbi:MAG: hypothetical protein GEV11_25545 [Streptosporangiales bacterium]|nr:hypothetical protein [Streptosporangiales bacterium]
MSLTIPLVVVAIVAMLVGVMGPGRCHGAIAKPPHRGCLRTTTGWFWKCPNHGRQVYFRLMARLGGGALPHRRVCEGCGQSTRFVRLNGTGKPFLGCSAYPRCTTKRFLDQPL